MRFTNSKTTKHNKECLMGCNCGKNRRINRKSSRMPIKKKGLTPNQRRAKIVKIQNKNKETQNTFEKRLYDKNDI